MRKQLPVALLSLFLLLPYFSTSQTVENCFKSKRYKVKKHKRGQGKVSYSAFPVHRKENGLYYLDDFEDGKFVALNNKGDTVMVFSVKNHLFHDTVSYYYFESGLRHQSDIYYEGNVMQRLHWGEYGELWKSEDYTSKPTRITEYWNNGRILYVQLDIEGDSDEPKKKGLARSLTKVQNAYVVKVHQQALLSKGLIGKLDNCLHLELRRLGLFRVPKSVAKLDQLQTLDLQNNNLRKLPEFLLELQNLCDVHVSNNYISWDDPVALKLRQQGVWVNFGKFNRRFYPSYPKRWLNKRKTTKIELNFYEMWVDKDQPICPEKLAKAGRWGCENCVKPESWGYDHCRNKHLFADPLRFYPNLNAIRFEHWCSEGTNDDLDSSKFERVRFQDWEFITKIEVVGNDYDYCMKTIPDQILEMDHLRYLSFDNTVLDSIPEGIANLESLEYLIIGRKYVKTTVYPEPRVINEYAYDSRWIDESFYLSDKMGELKNLKYLHMGGIKLDTLPTWITKLENLETLNIWACNLDIEQAMPLLLQMPNLKTLFINSKVIEGEYGKRKTVTLINEEQKATLREKIELCYF